MVTIPMASTIGKAATASAAGRFFRIITSRISR
jgi:hypothetical protein